MTKSDEKRRRIAVRYERPFAWSCETSAPQSRSDLMLAICGFVHVTDVDKSQPENSGICIKSHQEIQMEMGLLAPWKIDCLEPRGNRVHAYRL